MYSAHPEPAWLVWGARSEEVRSLCEAAVVSAEVEEGRRALTLHLSCRAALVPSRKGMVLWLDLATRSEVTISLLSGAFRRAGLGRSHPRAEWLWQPRFRRWWYRRAARQAVCTKAFSETFGVLASEHQGTFEELFEPVAALVPFETAPGPGMSSPWPFLVPDGTLLLDTTGGKVLLMPDEVEAELYWDLVGWLSFVDALAEGCRDYSRHTTLAPLPS